MTGVQTCALPILNLLTTSLSSIEGADFELWLQEKRKGNIAVVIADCLIKSLRVFIPGRVLIILILLSNEQMYVPFAHSVQVFTKAENLLNVQSCTNAH